MFHFLRRRKLASKPLIESSMARRAFAFGAPAAGLIALADSARAQQLSGAQAAFVVSAPPSAFPGLKRDYDASAITPVADATAIASWPDSSPTNDPAVQATGAQKPFYYNFQANGLPCVQFNGAQFMTFTRETDFQTIFLVCQLADPQVNDFAPIIGDGTSFDLVGPVKTSPYLVDTGSAPAAKFVAAIRINGAPSGILAQMVKPKGWSVITIRVPAGQNFALGNISMDRVGAGRAITGQYARVTLFNTALTDYQCSQVENYLCSRYNIPYLGKLSANAVVNGLFIGDSLTIGQGASISYPVALATLLGSTRLAIANLGISGTTAGPASGGAGPWNVLYFGQRVYALSSSFNPYISLNPSIINVFHVWLGDNDLYFSATVAATYAALTQIWAMCRAAGGKVIAYTIVARSGAGTPGNYDSQRALLNALIRSDPSQYDYLVDLAANQAIGYNGASADATYYQVDQIHLTTAGQAIVANMSIAAYKALGLA